MAAYTKLGPRVFMNGLYCQRYSVTLNGQTEVDVLTDFRTIESWIATKTPDAAEVPFYEVYARQSGAHLYVWCSDTNVTTDTVTIFVFGTN